MEADKNFIPRARMAGLCADEKAFASLTKEFQIAGYALESYETAKNADLGIIDIRGKRLSGRKALAYANLLRRNSPECAIFFIVSPGLEQTGRNALRRYGEVVCAGRGVDHLIERCRQMIRLRNVAEEAGERLKTLASLNRLADFPPLVTSSVAPRVLIAGDPGPAAMAVINEVRSVAGYSVCVLSPGQAMRALDHGDFDCGVFLPSGENNPFLSLARVLRRHPKYCTLPAICVAPDVETASSFARSGARDFILARHIAGDLSTRLQIATRRARLLKAMRGFLQSCNGEGVRDLSSGSFTSAFLAEHGARICARADQSKRDLSVIALKIVAECQNEQSDEPGRKAMHQAARLINRVTRAEDTVARIAADTFLVLAPSTNKRDAEKAALRIEGVLENTVFRSTRDEHLYAVTAETAVFARTPGEHIEEVAARALKMLREQEEREVRNAK